MSEFKVLICVDCLIDGYPSNRKFYAASAPDILESISDLEQIYSVSIEVAIGENPKAKADVDYALTMLKDAANVSYPFEPAMHATAWKTREYRRFPSREYKSLPSAILGKLSFEYEHFVHIPKGKNATDLSLIAYTENAEKGQRDIQNTVKLGRYLKRYHPTMSDEAIQECVRIYRAARMPETFRFQLATDTETVNEIFETEMYARDSSGTSCMYGKFSSWDTRPYHVYANSPDVALAYIRDSDNLIVARSVVSTLNSKYVRIYSVPRRFDSALSNVERETLCTTFAVILKDRGFSEGDLMGSRLTKVYRDSNILAPYLDGEQYVKSGKTHWTVVNSNDYDYTFSETNGYPSGHEPQEDEELWSCADCEWSTTDTGDLNETFENGDVCNSCLANYVHATHNSRNQTRLIHRDNAVEDCRGNWYTESYADNYMVVKDDEYHLADCSDLETECDNCSFRSSDENSFEDGLCSDCATVTKTCVDCDNEAENVGDYTKCGDLQFRCDTCAETYNAELKRKEYEREHQHTLTY